MEWIKCTDRLPPDSRPTYSRPPVLACTARGRCQAMHYDHDMKDWYCAQGDGYGVYGDITHWMPMPLPPPEQERKEIADSLYPEED